MEHLCTFTGGMGRKWIPIQNSRDHTGDLGKHNGLPGMPKDGNDQ